MKYLQNLVSQTRRDILRMVNNVNSGHPGGSLGCTEFLIVLFHKILKLKDKFEMDGVDEDLFFLSNGHISPVLYSVLARKGYFEVEELNTFRKINSRLQGHPATHADLPGIRIASGSLGQGLSVAIGAALTKKLNNDNCLVYSLQGDGELQEGQMWEAFMFASAKKVDNLITTIDCNGKQIDGSTDDVLSLGNIKDKLESFGWLTIEVKKGNDLMVIHNGLLEAIENTKKGRPVCILLSTEMGNGVDYMMNTHTWHGKAPNNEQLETALAQNPETFKDF